MLHKAHGKRTLPLVLALFVTWQFTACSQPPQDSNNSGANPDRPVVEAPQGQEDATLKAAKVQCSDTSPEHCPATVGMVLSRLIEDGKTVFEQCTGFLVNESTLATASHCVPSALRVAGASCDGMISVVFPATATLKSERVGCETVLSASEIESHGEPRFLKLPDYAFLKLSKPLQRGAISIGRAGISNAMKLSAFVIDPQSDTKIEGVLKAKTCVGVQKTALAPGFKNDTHPIATLAGCEIIPGNSGAPLVDAEGKARGVLHGVLSKGAASGSLLGGDMINKIVDAFRATGQQFETIAFATNGACVDAAGISGIGEIAADCDLHETTIDPLKAAASDVNEQVFKAGFDDWKTTAPPAFNYRIEKKLVRARSGSSNAFTPEIACVRDSSTWIDQVPSTSTRGMKQVTITFRAPNWTFKPSIDKFYRVQLTPTIVSHSTTVVEFDANKAVSGGTVEARRTTIQELDGSSDVQDPIVLSVCETL